MRLLLVIALASLIVTSEATATVAVQRDDTVWVASGNEPRLRRLVRGTNPVVVPGGHVVVGSRHRRWTHTECVSAA